MAACELVRNYTTRYCLFAIDSERDLDMLPTSDRVGSGDLIRSTTCCIGSRARSSVGKSYVLNGNNKWIECSWSGGGGGGDEPPEGSEITHEEIEDLFNNSASSGNSGGQPNGVTDISNEDIQNLFG